MNYGITDICATPAYMTMMIYLPLSYIESNFTYNDNNGRAEFILSKECPIMVGEHEFHLDYDIIFTRSKPQDTYIYTAKYDLPSDIVAMLLENEHINARYRRFLQVYLRRHWLPRDLEHYLEIFCDEELNKIYRKMKEEWKEFMRFRPITF
jgi:hypothetical protein